MTTESLELAILDSGHKDTLAVYARFGYDTACVLVSCPAELAALSAFGERFEKSVNGLGLEVSGSEVREYGEKLFNTVIRDSVADLYGAVPKNTPIRIHIFSNHAAIQGVPWEVMQHPESVPVPDRNRIVVRIVPTVGVLPFKPFPKGQRLRVLFAVAEPIDQAGTDWNATYALLRDKFKNRVDPNRVDLQFIRATNREILSSKLGQHFDVLHFYGHGEIKDNVGNLVFVDADGNSDYVPTPQLASLLGGTRVRLVILSACLTAAGKFQHDFTVLSKGLIKAGVPAVVANQSRVSPQTVAPFASVLYDNLLDHGDIDYAVSEARANLAFIMDYSKSDWAIPVLYRHISAATVLA